MGRNSAKETPPKPQLQNLCWSPIEQQMSSKLFQNCLSAGQRLSSLALTTSPTSLEQRAIQESKISSEICSAVSFWVQDLLSSLSPRSALRRAYQSPASPLLAPTVADRLTEGGRVFSVSLRWLENSCNHSKLKDSLKNVQLLFIHNRLNEVARLPTLIDWLRGGGVFSVSLLWFENSSNLSSFKIDNVQQKFLSRGTFICSWPTDWSQNQWFWQKGKSITIFVVRIEL